MKAIAIIGQVTEDGKHIKIESPKFHREVVNNLKEKRLEVQLKIYKKTRTSAQNRWLWGVCYKYIREYIKNTQGEVYTTEVIHEFTKQHILNDGSTGKLYFIEEENLKYIIQDIYNQSKDSNVESVIKYTTKSLKDALCNLYVKDIIGKPVISTIGMKSTRTLTTEEFSDMVDKILKFWAEKGCEIPLPNEE